MVLICKRIAIENPIGVMSTAYRKPDCIIQPYEFGEPERKATCLWLKGLPNIKFVVSNLSEDDMVYIVPDKAERERILLSFD